MISYILAAIDGSTRENAVFEAAAMMATRFGAKLVLFRALLVPPDFPPAAATHHPDPLPAHMVETVRLRMAELAAREPSLSIEFRIELAAQPWRAILRVSDELDVDLIVVGSHGYHGLDRVLGTTAGKVANLATRSVLVVHKRA